MPWTLAEHPASAFSGAIPGLGGSRLLRRLRGLGIPGGGRSLGVVPMVDTSVEVVKRSELIVAQLERVCMVGASWGVACELCALLCRPESRCTASCARYSALPTGGLKARLPQVGVGRWGKAFFVSIRLITRSSRFMGYLSILRGVRSSYNILATRLSPVSAVMRWPTAEGT